MKIWLPYVYAGTGSDVFTVTLANALRSRGMDVEVTCFPHKWQYFPWRMMLTDPPKGTDIILTNSWNGFAFKHGGVKLIVVEHLFVLDPALAPYRNLAQSIFHNILVRYFVRRSYVRADAVIALSKYAKTKMQQVFSFCVPTIISNGIDTEFFTPAESRQEKPKGSRFRLLFVGNPSKRKGADLLPPIMQRLGDEYELAYTSGLKDADPFQGLERMTSLGKLNKEETREAYRNADLLLFPSRLEGLPLVVMESLACGTPAVVVNTTSLPEMVTSHDNGYVAEKDNIDEIVNNIRKIAGSRTLLSKMRQAARTSAEQKYSLTKMTDNYLDLFRRLLNGEQHAK